MGQQEYDNFKRLVREWLDSHPKEYAAFVEEMNDKEFKGFFKVFKVATALAPKYREAARKRTLNDRATDFEELENILQGSDLAGKLVNEFHNPNRKSIIPCSHGCTTDGAMSAWWSRERNSPKERTYPDCTNGSSPAWSGSSSERA